MFRVFEVFRSAPSLIINLFDQRMGNAASGLPFKLADKLEYDAPQGLCELLRGVRTDKDELQVNVFKYPKPSPRLALAQRHWHKLRALKHPYVISYIDGVELEDSLLVVTEEATPLRNYLKSRKGSGEEIGITVEEVIWGIKCICQGISFLHNNCGFLHGFLGMHAIFVSKSGDWKLGRFDLTSSFPEDESFFQTHESLLSGKYCSSERTNMKSLSSPFPADVFSLGVLIQEIFSVNSLDVPADFEQLLRRMVMTDARRRPSLALVLKSSCFSSDKMSMLSTLDELMLKSAAEATEALNQFSSPESIAAISVELCSFKLLPCVARILTTSLEGFPQRDSREAARTAIQSCLKLLSLLGGSNKLQETHLSRTCVAQISALWGLSDRAIRTALLRTLPPLVPFLNALTVNGKIFDPLLNGFADNNLKMREDTLKSLVCLLDKLDEKNLQDKLVRCMCGLQSDAEAAIRTNATIFLGRLAPRLKENVRAKVLCQAFSKALKDVFLHCRVAGLKAALASLPLLVDCDYAQLVGKLLPQVCTLLIDKNEEVRRLSLQFVDEITVFVRTRSEQQAKADELAAAKLARSKAAAASSSGGNHRDTGNHSVGDDVVNDGAGHSSNAGNSSASKEESGWTGAWTSWAVESLSKSIEQVTTVSSSAASAGAGAHSAEIVFKNKPPAQKIPPKAVKAVATKEEGWGDEDDFLDDEEEEADEMSKQKVQSPLKTKTALASSKIKTVDMPVATTARGSLSSKVQSVWGDDADDDDWDEEEEQDTKKSVVAPAVPASKKVPVRPITTSSVPAKNTIPSKGTPISSKNGGASTKSLSSGWEAEDDDDLSFSDDDDVATAAKGNGGNSRDLSSDRANALPSPGNSSSSKTKVEIRREEEAPPPRRSLSSKSASSTDISAEAPTSASKKGAKNKVAVKKLAVDKEDGGWEDF